MASLMTGDMIPISLSLFSLALLSRLLSRPQDTKPAAAHDEESGGGRGSILGTDLREAALDSDCVVHVVGGGIAGLLAAFFLRERMIQQLRDTGFDAHSLSEMVKERLIVWESEGRVGGLLGSEQMSDRGIGAGIAERAANGVVWCDEFAYLCESLGLQHEVLPANAESNRRVHIVRSKQLRELKMNGLFGGFGPLTLWETLKTIGSALLPKFDAIWSSMDTRTSRSTSPFSIPSWTHPVRRMTIKDFGYYFLGKEATDLVLQPALGGIYGSDVSALGFSAVMKQLSETMIQSDIIGCRWLPWLFVKNAMSTPASTTPAVSPKKGVWDIRRGTLTCFNGGMQTLVDGLERHLRDHIRISTPVDNLQSLLGTTDGPSSQRHRVVLCTPAYVTSRLLSSIPDESLTREQIKDKQALVHATSEVQYASLASITMQFSADQIEKTPTVMSSFGCLIPSVEGMSTMGILFNSSIFMRGRVLQPNDRISITCIVKLDQDGDSDEQALLEHVLREVDTLLRFKQNDPDRRRPLSYKVFRYKHAIPIYSPNLQHSWSVMNRLLQRSFPSINLFGNYTGEVAVRGMCQQAARLLCQSKS